MKRGRFFGCDALARGGRWRWAGVGGALAAVIRVGRGALVVAAVHWG